MFKCNVEGCDKEPANQKALNKHRSRCHPELCKKLTSEQKKFECNDCEAKFGSTNGLWRHCKTKNHTSIPQGHDKSTEQSTKKQLECQDCSKWFPSHKKWLQHGHSAHKWSAKIDNKSFSNKEQFDEWFSITRRDSCVDFVATTGKKQKGDSKHQYLVCSRSGNPRPFAKRGDRVSRKSVKSGNICSAFMNVTENGDGTISSEYCLKHSGHDINPGKMRLSSAEKATIKEIWSEVGVGEENMASEGTEVELETQQVEVETEELEAETEKDTEASEDPEKLLEKVTQMLADLNVDALQQVASFVENIHKNTVDKLPVREDVRPQAKKLPQRRKERAEVLRKRKKLLKKRKTMAKPP